MCAGTLEGLAGELFMPPKVARLGDISKVPSDSHGCLACAHTCEGPAVKGSPNVFINGMNCVRVTDDGVHSGCCGPNTWVAKAGSGTVKVNGLQIHRVGDAVQHCGGMGKMQTGSPNVQAGG